MDKILIIAPHPDDESLGCGGTILRHKDNNDELYWLIVTGIDKEHGWNKDQIKKRNEEIKQVQEVYKFKKTYNLALPTKRIDLIPISEMINSIGKVINEIKPEILYIPFIADVHTDHQIIVKAVNACIKWYRYPSVKKVLSYETLSETDFNYSSNQKFQPNYYIDISKYIKQKIDICKIYDGEISNHPFPRSEKNIKALSLLRGGQSGFKAAEAFQLILQRY